MWAWRSTGTRIRGLYLPSSLGPLPCAGTDAAAMQRWGDSLDLKQLKVNLGRWEATERAAIPTWDSLRRAGVWTLPELEGRRMFAQQERLGAQRVATGDADLAAAEFPFDAMTAAEQEAKDAGNPPTRRVYVYGAGPTVPGQAAACQLRAAVVLTGDATDVPSQHLCGQLLDAAADVPVLIYGHPAVVGLVARQLADRNRTLQRRSVDAWIWPEDRAKNAEGRAVHRSIALLHPVGSVDPAKV